MFVLLYQFVVFDDNMPPSAPFVCNWYIRFAWLGIDHLIGDAFSHNSLTTGCLWEKCCFEHGAGQVDVGCVCAFSRLLLKHFHCSQVLFRRFAPTPCSYRCLVLVYCSSNVSPSSCLRSFNSTLSRVTFILLRT